MFALNTSPKSPIPYYRLPDNAYNAARDSIVNLGFSLEAILDNYSFSTKEEQLVKTNALVFAHPRHRTLADYASFTLYNARNGLDNEKIVQTLAQTAAPFHLIHRNDSFSFWASGIQDNQVKPIHIESNIDYTQLGGVLSNYAVDLKPQKIIDVKQGRAQFTHPAFADAGLQPLQLSLWAVDVTRPLLVRYFGQAVDILRNYLKNDESTVVDLATQLLGATILADTGVLGDGVRNDEQGLNLNKLVQAAQSRFPNYFKEQLFNNHFDIAEQAYALLRQIRYVGFAPEMLTEIYKQAYDEKRRKELGRYDTPLYLTRRIWDNIPVEFLPPDQRVTVDMTCGWGSFLLSGYKRLSSLNDRQGVLLRQQLHGNDIEPLAARLAGLGLLISTSEDNWHIDHEDAVEWSWLNRNQPNIIVGNPPFGGARKGEQKRTSPTGRERYEESNRFLERAINRLAPNGYLAMIMPQSFVASEASPGLRKQLLESCDVLELWELPIGVFPEAAAGTVVIFAKKQNISRRKISTTVRTRTVQRETLKEFKEIGIFTATGIVIDQSYWNEKSRKSEHSKNTHIIDYQLTLPEFVWREIKANCVEIGKLVVIFPGAIVGNPERGDWTDYQFPKRVSWLTNAKNIIKRSFFVDYDESTIILYPNELEWPRKDKKNRKKDKERFLANKKILLTATHNPSWGLRVKVAIERQGYYVSDSFWVLVPTPEAELRHITHEVIAAVVNWKVSNAWIVEHLKYPKIPARAIRNIPFPSNLSKKDCDALTEAVLQLESAAIANQPESADALQAIDTILKAAYQLDDETFERLRLIYEWDNNPQITLDPPYPDPEATWIINGVVDNINAQEGQITLWLDGFDELQTVPIHPAMPGWMLRPEVAFRTKIPRDCAWQQNLAKVVWGQFYPQNYTYLSEEELFTDLTNIFHPEISK